MTHTSLGPVRFVVLATLVAAGGGAPARAAGSPKAATRHTSSRRASTKPEARHDLAARSRRGLFFQRNWGIEVVGVRRVSSGMMLRFDYKVVDPALAARLAEKKARPYLVDEVTGIALAVPAMEKVGELRQTGKLEVGRRYFIIFGNPGGLVKPGGRVTLTVGSDRAQGLVVEG